MSIRILLDMNLSPAWKPVLESQSWETIHWSDVGVASATDQTIMQWAVSHHYIVFTHDLDFGTMLALTHAQGPSVLQVRADDILPDQLQNLVIAAIRQHAEDLAQGALVVVDANKRRVRILPL